MEFWWDLSLQTDFTMKPRNHERCSLKPSQQDQHVWHGTHDVWAACLGPWLLACVVYLQPAMIHGNRLSYCEAARKEVGNNTYCSRFFLTGSSICHFYFQGICSRSLEENICFGLNSHPGFKHWKALKGREKSFSGCKILLHLLVKLNFFEHSSFLYHRL